MTHSSASPGLSFDAVTTLGFVPSEPMPTAEPGTIAIRYGGWSMLELREKHRAQFHSHDWYDSYAWAAEKLPSGIYGLRLPIPDSNGKTFDEQKTLLLPGEEPAPVVIVASALLSIQVSNQPDPLKRHSIRCKEQTADGRRVALRWYVGRLVLNGGWDDSRSGYRWLSSSRRTS